MAGLKCTGGFRFLFTPRVSQLGVICSGAAKETV